ncbi:hypothetical protein MBLNU459_g4408t1 [Dothideomycetes sp. NU459]
MDAGGLAQMTYNGFPPNGLGVPGSGYGSRNRGHGVNKANRLSVALPPKVNPISEDYIDSNPTPRTSRSHLLAGLRTAPKTPAAPASAPYNQSQYQHHGFGGQDFGYLQSMPQTATGAGFGNHQYAAQAARQQQQQQQHMYATPEQVMAPPTFFGQDPEMDPSVLAELQLTSMYLAQRQQQLQAQLASITAAAGQYQGMGNQFQQGQMAPQSAMYGQQQQSQAPIEVPGQPGVYLVLNPMTGQYQYAVDNNAAQRSLSPPAQQQYGNMTATPNKYEQQQQQPTFRAEISPPPTERPTPNTSRSITPPKRTTPSPASSLAHVEPLPPPSANAFRRGHKKASSLAISSTGGYSDGPKTASTATFGSARTVLPQAPMTGTFGPGAARAGEHPMRQPRNPPPLEELVALPTAKHEGSKNFATRQRRAALSNLMRAGSVRRAFSGSSRGSPISETELSFQSEEDEPGFRKQSPIGSERVVNRGSNGSLEGLGAGGAVQTPTSETSDAFDMANFVKQLPSPVQREDNRRKMMMGVLTAAEKRKSSMF